jgi:hypothetical protein
MEAAGQRPVAGASVLARVTAIGRRVCAVTVGLAAIILLATAPAAGAAASPFTSSYVTNGRVQAVALDPSGRIYLGGSFTQVGPRTGHGVQLTSSSDQPASGFPDVSGGFNGGGINAVAGDGSGGWFIGGSFTSAGGVSRSGLAHINADGSVDPTWNPSPDSTVLALAVSGSSVYAAGDFLSIGGQTRSYIAKLSSTGTGAADPTWNPNAQNSVAALAVSSDGSVYAAGSFTSIGGQTRSHLAKLSGTGTGAADATWNPNPNISVVALAVSSDGSSVYAGGGFTSIGGQPRSHLAKLSSTSTGAADATWNPSPDNDVEALALSGDGASVYAGGFFSTIGGQTRSRIAKLSTTGTGAADATWNPNSQSTVSVLAVSSDGNSVYAGGDFTSIGGQSRRDLAKLSSTSTGAADTTWNPNPSDPPRALAVAGGVLYAGGAFTSVGGSARKNIARLNADGTLDTTWNPTADQEVDSLAVSSDGGSVYAGGQFNSIGGQPRSNIAKLSSTGTGPADATWDPTANDAVFALALSSDGSDVYAAGFFTFIGGQPRSNIAKLSTTGTGAADATWNPAPDSNVSALALSSDGSSVYAGGRFNTIGGQPRSGIAKLSTTGTGAADATWSPNAIGNGVSALAISSDGASVYAGGDFTEIGGQPRSNIAKLSSTGTGAADGTWNPDPNSGVFALAVAGDGSVYAGGDFNQLGGQGSSHLARLSGTGAGAADATWNPGADDTVSALAISASRLVAGGAFTTVGSLSTQGVAEFDAGAPVISIATPPEGARYARGQVVNASYSCIDSDGPSDVASCSGPVSSGSPIDTLSTGSHSFTVNASDQAGNTSSRSASYTVDGSAPTISVTTPANAATYTQGQVVNAGYSCTDPDGSGDVASCDGPVSSGSPIDTSTTGSHNFTVNASDRAGNASLQSASYTVVAAPSGGETGGPGTTGPTGTTPPSGPAGPTGTTGPAGPTAPTSPTAVKLTIAGGSVSINARTGKGTVTATCHGPAGDVCRFTGGVYGPGKITIAAKSKSKAATKFGSVSGTIAVGKHGKLAVKLTPSALRQLKRKHRLVTQLAGTVTSRAGKRTTLRATLPLKLQSVTRRSRDLWSSLLG